MKRITALIITFLFIATALLPLISTNASATGDSWIIRPNADGGTKAWSIYPTSPTTHYDKIDETTAGGNGDTDYVYKSITDSEDDYYLSNMPTGKTIASVEVWVIAEKISGDPALDVELYPSDWSWYGSVVHITALTTSYANYSSGLLTVCPWTSAAWTPTIVNDMCTFLWITTGGGVIRVTQLGIIIREPSAPATWAPTFTSTPITNVKKNSAYSYTVTANETCTGWAMSSNATWLSFGAANHTVYGRPSLAPRSYYVHVNATSSAGHRIAWQNYTLHVNIWNPSFTSSPITSCNVNAAYSYGATANETVTWYFNTNATGILSFGAANHTVYGRPAVVASYWVLLIITNAESGTATQNYTLHVGAWNPTFTNSGTTTGKMGYPYSYTATANETCTWYFNTNSSLSFGAGNHTVYGRPSSLGTFWVYLKITNAVGGTAEQNYTITVSVWFSPTITSSPVLNTPQDSIYEYYVTTNSTCTFTMTTNASFLGIGYSSGIISGTPTISPRSYWVNVTANSSIGGGSAYQNYTFKVTIPNVPTWTGHIITTADTYIEGGLPNNNYGTNTAIYSGSLNFYKKAMFRWNLSAVLPAGAIIYDIDFLVYKTYDSISSDSYLMQGRALDWAENKVTWNTLGNGYCWEGSIPGIGIFETHWDDGSGYWINYSSTGLTSVANTQWQTYGKIYLTIAGQNANEYKGWATKESANDPYIRIYYSTPNPYWGPTYTSSPVTSATTGDAYTYHVTTNCSSIFSMQTNASWLSLAQPVSPAPRCWINGTAPTTTGTFWVNVTVWSPLGSRYTHQNYTITVHDNDNPVANAGPDRSIVQNYTVILDGSASSDNVGITNWWWNYTDHGSSHSISGTNGTPFAIVIDMWGMGIITVTLKVKDAAGNSATDTMTVTVGRGFILYPNQDFGISWDIVYPASPTTHWDKVDDRGHNDTNSTYIQTAADHYDFYKFTHFDVLPGEVVMKVTIFAEFTNVSAGAQVKFTLGYWAPVGYYGVAWWLTSSQAWLNRTYVMTTNPHYGGAWTESQINNMAVYVRQYGTGDCRVTKVGVIITMGWLPTFTSAPITTGSGGVPYSYTATTNETCTFALAGTATAFLTINPVTGIVSGTPTIFQCGAWSVIITATNAVGGSQTQSYTLNIADITPPVANAGVDQNKAQHQTVTFDGTGSTDNVGVVNYTWTWTDGVAKTAYGVHGTSVFNNIGVFTVTLTVRDAVGLTGVDTMLVTVTDADAPVANAGPDQYVNQHTTVTFDGTASTDNVGITEYRWAIPEGGIVYVYGVHGTYLFENAGTFVVTLRVKDAVGLTSTDTMVVYVADADPPVADAGPPQTVNQHATITFDGTGSTDNVGIVNYTWSWTDGGLRYAYGVHGTAVFDNVGTFTVTLIVRDAVGLSSASDTMQVTILDITPPVAVLGNVAWNLNKDGWIGATLSSSSTDNVGIVNWTWTLDYDGTIYTLYGIHPVFNFDVLGDWNYTVVVRDAVGLTDSASAVIFIRPFVAGPYDWLAMGGILMIIAVLGFFMMFFGPFVAVAYARNSDAETKVDAFILLVVIEAIGYGLFWGGTGGLG